MNIKYLLALVLAVILASCTAPTAEQSASAWVGGEAHYRSSNEDRCSFLEPYLLNNLLTRHDCLMIQQTIRHALEYAPDGHLSTWKNPRSGNEGRLVITTTLIQAEKLPMRKYKMIILIRGKAYVLEGLARRTPSGQWILS